MHSSIKCSQRYYAANQIWSYRNNRSFTKRVIGNKRQNPDKTEPKELQAGMDWEKSKI